MIPREYSFSGQFVAEKTIFKYFFLYISIKKYHNDPNFPLGSWFKLGIYPTRECFEKKILKGCLL